MGIRFGTLDATPFHVAVKHRNHLALMTASSYPLNTGTPFLDMTSAATLLYGEAAAATVGNVRCLWMGDANGDGVVRYAEANNDKDAILEPLQDVPSGRLYGYHRADVDLDGVVKGAGISNDRDQVLFSLGGLSPLETRAAQLP